MQPCTHISTHTPAASPTNAHKCPQQRDDILEGVVDKPNQRVAHVFICFYCVTLKHTQLIGSVVSSAGNQSGNGPIHPQHTHRPFQFSVEFLSAYLFLLFFKKKILPPVLVIRARLLNLPGRCRQKQNQPSCRELTETR